MAIPSKVLKAIIKSKQPSVPKQMVSKTKKELEEIVNKTTGDSVKGMAARNELARREERAAFKSGNPTYRGEKLKDSEAPKYNRGGASKKAPAKKPVARKSTERK